MKQHPTNAGKKTAETIYCKLSDRGKSSAVPVNNVGNDVRAACAAGLQVGAEVRQPWLHL
jgi:hypothetical protein